MKKHVVLVLLLILLFGVFIYFYLRTTSYELQYEIDDFSIIEKYDKELNAYYFTINYDDKTYELVSLDKYTNKRKLITDVILTEEEENTCLSFETTNIKLYDICSDDQGYFMANINDHDEFNKKDSYENINIATLDDKTYLLWNYHDFIYLNDSQKEKLTLFQTDVYNLSLIYKFANYLLVPNYEQNYLFDKLYVINTDKASISTINLRFDIYFNSYFLGNDENKVYIYDLREDQEFYIDLKKEEIYTSKNIILNNGNWESISKQTFQKEKPTFSNEEPLEVVLQDSSLYLQTLYSQNKVLLTNRKVSELVEVSGLDIYYIADAILYKYSPYEGETALLEYSEWNFNHQNMVFIFD